MSSMLSELFGQLAGDSLKPLSKQLGTDRDATQTAITAALPLLMGALARNASEPGGAQSLHKALAKDHDGSVLDNLGGYFGQGETSDGDGILGHTLGDRRAAVEQGVAKASGLDLAKVGPLLAMLAPLVMGTLGRKQRSKQVDAGGLSQMLGEERAATERKAPGLGGLASLLDRDGDGQIADDLLGGAGKKLLGSLLGGRR